MRDRTQMLVSSTLSLLINVESYGSLCLSLGYSNYVHAEQGRPSHTYRHLTLHFCYLVPPEQLYQMNRRQTYCVESSLKGLLTHASGMDSSTCCAYTVIHPQPVNHNAYVKHIFQRHFLYNCNKCPNWLNHKLNKTR